MNHIEKFRSLSAREREVLDLFCQGLSQDEIAGRLFISPKTFRAHMSHIYQKLDLTHLTARARAFTLREDYWPLHKSEPQPVEQTVDEPEVIDPVAPEVELLVTQDESVMRALVVSKPLEMQAPAVPRRRSFFTWLGVALLFVILAVVGIWYFELGRFSLQLLSEATATEEPTQTRLVQSTSTPVLPTITATATEAVTPALTLTPSPQPSPTINLGPVYEMGEWHKEGDLWFRLSDYSVDSQGIYIVVEMWNQTGQTVYFQWSTNSSMFLRDNKNNRYTVDSRTNGNVDNEIVPANTRKIIGTDPYIDITNWYDPDNLFLSGVTDLFFTLDYFSNVERATWRIPVGN